MQVRNFIYYTICKFFPKTQYWGRSILVLWQICFSRPVALQDTLHHNTGYSEQNQFLTNFVFFSRPVALQDTLHHNTGYTEQNQFLTNFIKTKCQPGFKPKFKLEFKPKFKLEVKPKFKPETRAGASHDEPARSSFNHITVAPPLIVFKSFFIDYYYFSSILNLL